MRSTHIPSMKYRLPPLPARVLCMEAGSSSRSPSVPACPPIKGQLTRSRQKGLERETAGSVHKNFIFVQGLCTIKVDGGDGSVYNGFKLLKTDSGSVKTKALFC